MGFIFSLHGSECCSLDTRFGIQLQYIEDIVVVYYKIGLARLLSGRQWSSICSQFYMLL